MIRQFKVILMNMGSGLTTHLVNCADEISARHISESIFKGMRVIDILEISH